ncbi:acetyl-CoA carboxylase biotin carboxyl carrier protein subunit [Pseudomonas japonica]|uniref:acetyl-CoA carboxylase biotin carboxyl carrier protein subunit n=1 Tax=Pseudomonas TaxID=286 RepID=UPI0029281B56|nr:biotin/lipoyl-containing protein [Pseudomonas sp. zfem002]MDU9393641.1 biotin/lipoyl-containing protein [Pseudomonas sp. zfem002]
MSRSAPNTSLSTLAGNVEGDAGTAQVHIEELGEQRYQAVFADGRTVLLEVLRQDELSRHGTRLALNVEGRRQTVHFTSTGTHTAILDHAGNRREISWHGARRREGGASSSRRDFGNSLLAPMPARVLELLVDADSLVEENQPLLRIEAMKMVMTLSAPGRRRIEALHVQAEDSVLAGQLLITFAQAD